jgi:hypothetical protein
MDCKLRDGRKGEEERERERLQAAMHAEKVDRCDESHLRSAFTRALRSRLRWGNAH